MEAAQRNTILLPGKRQRQPRLPEQSDPCSAQCADHILETLPRERATDPLVFKSINFMGQDSYPSPANVTRAELKLFLDFLGEAFDAVAVSYSGSFLDILCDHVPPVDQRPFSIGGFIALWTTHSTGPFYPVPGDLGGAPDLKLDKFNDQIYYNAIPSVPAAEYLANSIFPDCEAITFIDRNLVIEFPEMDPDAWCEKLAGLPYRFKDNGAILWYHNGPLAATACAQRDVKPDPSNLHAPRADETDYVARDGKFYPGTMVSSLDAQGRVYQSASAGIMVEKGGQRRLICPYHAWEEHDQKYPGLLGQGTEQAARSFRAAQGADGDVAGTVVGHLETRLPDCDFGLVKVDERFSFENIIMDTEIRPKTLLRLDEVKVGDEYVFESFITGQQRVRCLGQRFPIVRPHRSTAHPELSVPLGQSHLLPPDNVGYVRLWQGVYATNAPIIKAQPQIRASVCGSVLVRCMNSGEPGEDEERRVLERGEVAGMLHYADLKALYLSTPGLLMFADSMDPVIDGGWKVSE